MAEDQGDKDLFDRLNVEHPDYKEWKENWERYRDVLGEAEPKKENYLPRGEFEDDTVYRIRMKLAEFIPESSIPVNKLVAAIYDQQPTRDFKSREVEDFAKNVDLKGTTWPEFTERIARKLIGYGTTRVLVNVRVPEEAKALREANGRPLSVQEEKDLGVRVFAINYSPLAIIDWETDDFGSVTRVMIREEKKVKAQDPKPGAEHDDRVKFIEYTETMVSSTVFVKRSNGDVEKISEDIGEHGLGMVPMVIDYYPEEIKAMIASGFIRYISKADIRKIRAESDLHYDGYVHSHPVFYYRGQEELGTVGVGASTYLKIGPEEEVGYVTMPQAVTENLKAIVDLNIDSMHRHAGTDPLGQLTTSNSVFQASGAARAWSFGTSEARVLKDIANTMQRVEMRILEIAARFLTPSEVPLSRDDQVFKGEISYSEEYDPTATVQLMENAERSEGLVNSETFHKLQAKRIAIRLAGEVTPEMTKTILEEIESNPLKSEERISGLGFEIPDISGEDDDDGAKPDDDQSTRGRESRRNRSRQRPSGSPV